MTVSTVMRECRACGWQFRGVGRTPKCCTGCGSWWTESFPDRDARLEREGRAWAATPADIERAQAGRPASLNGVPTGQKCDRCFEDLTWDDQCEVMGADGFTAICHVGCMRPFDRMA